MDKKKTLTIGLSGNLLSDQRMQRIAQALHEDGWSVTVLYRNYYKYDAGAKPAADHRPYHSEAIRCLFSAGIGFYLCFNLMLFLKLLFRKTDAYYAVDSDTLPAFILLSLIRRKRLIYDAHEYFSEVPELKGKTVKKRIWHLITKMGVARADTCITVGPLLAAELERVYKKPFHALRNVPLWQSNPSAPAFERPVLLYQGALNEGRMLELLIQAMKDLPEFDCILAGEGDLSKTLRAAAAGLPNVRFAGLMTPGALRELTPRCFAGFNLLDASGSLSYYYSLSNKYFDYMQAGIPSVSSDLPEYAALNARWDCGICIENSQTALISVLRAWKNNPPLYAKLKENAKFAAEANHWALEKQMLLNLIRP